MTWMSNSNIRRQNKIWKYKKKVRLGELFNIPENKVLNGKFYYEYEMRRLKKLRRRVR